MLVPGAQCVDIMVHCVGKLEQIKQNRFLIRHIANYIMLYLLKWSFIDVWYTRTLYVDWNEFYNEISLFRFDFDIVD